MGKKRKGINDCYFYYGGLGLCERGAKCCYRHEPSARGCQTVCERWQRGRCTDLKCPLRHSHHDLLPFGILEDRQGGTPKYLAKKCFNMPRREREHRSKSRKPKPQCRWNRFARIAKYTDEGQMKKSNEKSNYFSNKKRTYINCGVKDDPSIREQKGEFSNFSRDVNINRRSLSQPRTSGSISMINNIKIDPNEQCKVKLENIKREIVENKLIKLESVVKTEKNT